MRETQSGRTKTGDDILLRTVEESLVTSQWKSDLNPLFLCLYRGTEHLNPLYYTKTHHWKACPPSAEKHNVEAEVMFSAASSVL